jgi:putative transposase
MFGYQQVLIKLDKETEAILEYLCSESAKLSNCGIYYSRQLYFKTGRIPNRAELHKVLGTENQNLHYKAFYSDTAQQILTGVAESFKSFMGLLKGIKEGRVTQRPKLPGYRQSGMALVTFTGRSVKLKDGMLRFPLGSKVKTWFGLDAFFSTHALES